MFCPNCFYEYKEGIKTCPDCKVELVADNPVDEDESDLPDIQVAELTEVNNDMESQILRDMLMQEGIHSFMRSNVLPHSRLPLGGLFSSRKYGTIIVNKEDLVKAKEVLKDYKNL